MQLRFLLFLISTIIVVARAATVADVLTHLKKFKTQVTELENTVQRLPNQGGDPLKIHNDAMSAKSTFDAATSDAKTVKAPMLELDGQRLLAVIGDIAPIVLSLLKDIVAKKAAFDSVSFSVEFIKKDLTGIKKSADNFWDTLISKFPPDLGAPADHSKVILDNAFDEAIAVYSELVV